MISPVNRIMSQFATLETQSGAERKTNSDSEQHRVQSPNPRHTPPLKARFADFQGVANFHLDVLQLAAVYESQQLLK